jgi:hypothetical protein
MILVADDMLHTAVAADVLAIPDPQLPSLRSTERWATRRLTPRSRKGFRPVSATQGCKADDRPIMLGVLAGVIAGEAA